jgi:TetR/AcrR family transcriptional regulator, transcriptional repressor for nem operon
LRTSRQVKDQHHKEIVSTASKMLRDRGIEQTSVMDLMRAAGLTNGGFYRHFKSKEELVAEATRKVYQELIAIMQERLERLGAKAALSAYVDDYLSECHVDAPDEGCAVAAYGAEAAREGGAVRQAFAEGMAQLLPLLAEGMPGPKAQRWERAAELQALMTGAVVMARTAGDAELSAEILNSARRRAAQLIGSAAPRASGERRTGRARRQPQSAE